MPACAGPRLAGHGQGWKQPCARSAAGEAKLRAHQVLQGDHGSRWGGVCLPALRVGVGDHTRSLSRRCQGRRPGSVEEDGTDGIVPSDSVPVASTPNLVVSIGVRCAAALWAGVTGAMKWHSQPVPQAAAELLPGTLGQEQRVHA